MRIALLTIWHCYNYGAELQTYATVRALKELGHDVVVIDYRLSPRTSPNGFLRKLSKALHYVAPAELKFHLFWHKYIPRTRYYDSIEDLTADPPKADLYLVGSDQVWNPQITGDRTPAYFLAFAPKEQVLASYASSIGTDTWLGGEAITRIAQEQLNRFKGIACRESQGCRIIKETFGLSAAQVLDPTLLHKSYPELTEKINKKNTLVYYQLSETPQLKAFAEKKAAEMGLEFVDVNKQIRLTPTFGWNRRSVQQWLKTIAESKFVITHSFHGVAMCILYHIDFVAIYASGNRISRIQHLLCIVGLQDRLLTSFEDAKRSYVWHKSIDYDRVDKLLENQRKSSWKYLKQITET